MHTEFRVFYDFDNRDIVGISNYWNPDVMTFEKLRKDYLAYHSAKEKIVDEYALYKSTVLKEVSLYMEKVQGLTGKWSVDVMKNGEDFWLIDMARMEFSALVSVMEKT